MQALSKAARDTGDIRHASASRSYASKLATVARILESAAARARRAVHPSARAWEAGQALPGSETVTASVTGSRCSTIGAGVRERSVGRLGSRDPHACGERQNGSECIWRVSNVTFFLLAQHSLTRNRE